MSESTIVHNPHNKYRIDAGRWFLPIVILSVFMFVSIIFYLNVGVVDVADMESYIQISDRLFYFSANSDFYFEPGSNVLIYIARSIAGSAESAVNILRAITTLLLIVFLIYCIRNQKLSPVAICLILAAYGPLLGYVTIRATPAYILTLLATMDAINGRLRALLLLALACQFHISAALMAPSITICLLQSKTNLLRIVEQSTVGIIVFFGTLGIIYLSFSSSLANLMVTLVNQVGFLSKYVTYVGTLDNTREAVNQATESQVFHNAYLGVCGLMFLMLVASRESALLKMRGYFIISFGIFIFLQFAPVTAYRLSIYWMLAGLALYPWERLLKVRALQAVAVIIALSVFLFQMNSIVIGGWIL